MSLPACNFCGLVGILGLVFPDLYCMIKHKSSRDACDAVTPYKVEKDLCLCVVVYVNLDVHNASHST